MVASYHYYYVLKIITLGQLGEAMPDDQILLWEQKATPELPLKSHGLLLAARGEARRFVAYCPRGSWARRSNQRVQPRKCFRKTTLRLVSHALLLAALEINAREEAT